MRSLRVTAVLIGAATIVGAYVAIMAGGGRPVARKVDESHLGGRLHVYALAEAK